MVHPVPGLEAYVDPFHCPLHRLWLDRPALVRDAHTLVLEVHSSGTDAWELLQSPFHPPGSQVTQDPVGPKGHFGLSPPRGHV